MIEAGKKELLNKRLKKIEEQHYDNPYDKLVQKVMLRQEQDMNRMKDNNMFFKENVHHNNRMKELRRREKEATDAA